MQQLNDFSNQIKRLVGLYIEDARLNLTEKLTRILSGVAIAFICILFMVICLAFLSIGIVAELKTVMSPPVAYLIVAGFYVVLILALIIFKRTLLLNPIARFLSRIILKAPEAGTDKNIDENEQQ